MHRGKITRKLICKQSADVCKTIHKSVVAGNEPCYNDVDFYEVTLNEAGLFSIKGIFRTNRIRLRLYDDFGEKLYGDWWGIDSLSQRGSFEHSWNLTKGTYYISADRIRSNTTGTYSFSLGHKSANETFSEAQGGSNNNSDDADQIEFDKFVERTWGAPIKRERMMGEPEDVPAKKVRKTKAE